MKMIKLYTEDGKSKGHVINKFHCRDEFVNHTIYNHDRTGQIIPYEKYTEFNNSKNQIMQILFDKHTDFIGKTPFIMQKYIFEIYNINIGIQKIKKILKSEQYRYDDWNKFKPKKYPYDRDPENL